MLRKIDFGAFQLKDTWSGFDTELSAIANSPGLTNHSWDHQPQSCAIQHWDYCETAKTSALVFDDGSAALFRTSDAGLLPFSEYEMGHWISAEGALCSQIGAPCHLVAVGMVSGVVALNRLSSIDGSFPVCITGLLMLLQ